MTLISLNSEHLCMFTEMGWLDSSYNFDNVTAETDVLSLPANVNINTNFQTVYKVKREGVAGTDCD